MSLTGIEGLEEERCDPTKARNGQALALLNVPMANPVRPKLAESGCYDGIYLRIYKHPDGFVAGHASRPDWSRKQLNISRLVSSYDAAKAVLVEYIVRARAFCANPINEANCPLPHVVGATKWARDNWCRECGWSEPKKARRAR